MVDEPTANQLKNILIELLNIRIITNDDHIQWEKIQTEAHNVLVDGVDAFYPSAQQKATLLLNLIYEQKKNETSSTTHSFLKMDSSATSPEIRKQLLRSLLNTFADHEVNMISFVYSDMK